jgi:L-asparaginase II
MQHQDTVPLVQTTRGVLVETVHRGAVAVVNTTGQILYAAGNPELKTFMRSASKPFQLLPTIEAGAIEKYDLQANEISVMCASHSGEDYHLQAVRSILRKIGLSEESLQSGPHLPGHLPTQRAMIKQDRQPCAIHSNCSGKHVGMLALCQLKGFPIDGYLELGHPAQQLILKTLAEMADTDPSEIDIGIDGCGVPTFALPIWRIGVLFACLADANPEHPHRRQQVLAQIRDAMMTEPKYMSGSGRFCAEMMTQLPGEVVMKSGAAGVYGLGLVRSGIGLAVKVENGQGEPRQTTVLETLRQLKTLGSISIRGETEALWRKFCPSIRNFHRQKVGKTELTFQLQPISVI